MITEALQDVVFGIRLLRKSLSFTVTAILLLGLGIGVVTAVFSLVNSVLFRELPYRDSSRIVMPWNVPPINLNLNNFYPWGPIQFHAMEGETKIFQAIGAFQGGSFNLSGTGEPILLEGMRVSYGFFPALGIAPSLGRIFTSEEDQPGHEYEVLLSQHLWRDHFHSDPQIIGRAIDLNGLPFTVVGVMPYGFAFPHANEMPETFHFPREAQLWVPAAIPAATPPFTPFELAVVARLQDGVSVAQAQAAMKVFASRMDKLNPALKGWFSSQVTPLKRQIGGDSRRPLLLMLSAVTSVLFIICINLTSLVLVRFIGRQRELGIRAALGASRLRILRQPLTESLLLAIAGGVVGLVLSLICIHLFRVYGPSSIPRLQEAALDRRTFSFALTVTFLASVIVGFAPAISATRIDLARSFREGGQKAGSASSYLYLRNTLVILQIGLSLVLIVTAGLFIRTFQHIIGEDGGFHAEHVLTFELSLPAIQYPDRQHIVQFYDQALLKFRSVAGVQAAAITEAVPMEGAPESTEVYIRNRPSDRKNDVPIVSYTVISPGFFTTLGTALDQGRDFLESDNMSGQAVTIINRAMARRYWPGENAIGKQIIVPAQKQPMTIVGIVADIKHSSLREEPVPEMFIPYTQDAWPSIAIMQVVLRSRADPDSVVGGARNVLHTLDPRLPLAKLTTLTQLTNSTLSKEKASMLILGCFGVLSLLLAAIGIYGVVSYSLSQRTREIGIRMAVGASRENILRLILQHVFRLTAAGIGLGVIGALIAVQSINSYLYGVPKYDPITFGAAALILGLAAMVAGIFPARYAASLDPVQALKAE